MAATTQAAYEILPTKSAKIRAMAADGVPRAEIARRLGIRYQHVRKVLVDEQARRAKSDAAGRATVGGEGARPATARVKLGPDGRLVIPAAFRESLGLKEGDVLVASLENGEIHLLTMAAAVRRARAIIRKYVPEGVSLADELIADRRREADEEMRDG